MASILVVEDDPSDRLMLQSVLEGAGHTVLFAPDGDRALQIYEQGDVQIVVTDLVMPRLNGWQLIRNLRALDPEARIIALSMSELLALAEEYGAIRALSKPLDPSALLEAVRLAQYEPPRSTDPWVYVRQP